MTREPGIWSRLQEYEIPPPQEVFDTVCALVNLDDLKQTENDQEQVNNLERLRHFEVQPPAILRSSIENLISRTVAPTSSSKVPGRRRLSFYGFRAVAACLLLTTAGWLFYQVIHSHHLPTAIAKKNNPIIPFKENAAIQQTDSLPEKDKHSMTDSLSEKNTLADNDSAVNSNALVKSGKYKQISTFSINGQRLSLTDNDLLITFVNLKYNEMPGFINRSNEGDWKIRIDQYTSILISKPMSEMMREMALFKPDGTLTRKARKSREKLDKWKKSDEAQFDQSLKKNPLDPIDLGEFIFK